MDANATKARSRQFAVKIAQIYKNLSNNKKEYVMSEQLLRAGTGIGADLAASECAATRSDFVAKVHEALQKCAVTRYWLEILGEVDLITEFERKSCVQDCDELRNILVYTIRALKTPPATVTASARNASAPAAPAKNVSRET
jgi:four helix bundle protein